MAIGLALNPDALGELRFGPEPLVFAAPHLDAFSTAGVLLLTAQLPLTIANSVVATADTAASYFPAASDRVTPRRLSLSIALGNLWAGFTGGLPVCHGSGGLTAHYSFGARRPLSTAIIGVALIVVALMFGHAGLVIRRVVPLPFFGLLLLFVGIQHARLAMGVTTAVDAGFVLLTGALTVVFDGNLAYAAIASMATYWLARNAVVDRAARALYGRRVLRFPDLEQPGRNGDGDDDPCGESGSQNGGDSARPERAVRPAKTCRSPRALQAATHYI